MSSATAIWQGDFEHGEGSVSTSGGALSHARYSAASRRDVATGSNPEEMLAAAHAACFSMALTYEMDQVGVLPIKVGTQADVRLEQVPGSFNVSSVHLTVNAEVRPGQRSAMLAAARAAKVSCPISRLLNVQITMDVNVKS